MAYKPSEIEPRWQQYWLERGTFEAKEDRTKQKFYALDMFPYPSGKGLHVGHPAGYTANDVVCRYKRARGFNVLHPMGYDSFGLPAEQKAIDEGIPPQISTEEAIQNFRRQLRRLGYSYDWSRELSTCDPKYYKWTQWIFTKLFEKGLAYRGQQYVNWCAALGTVLANDEVIDGKSERGGHPVERKLLNQWMIKQTAFADRLLAGHQHIDWPEATKTKQREFIGRSEGAFVDFRVENLDEKITVFTTRPDTLWGATYMVLAPEHPIVERITSAQQREAVEKYQRYASSRSEVDRKASKTKTGVATGAHAINPVNGKPIPIWIADYVIAGYGTGAIMAVPAHDERDWEFAKAMSLPIVEVISGGKVDEAAHTGEGTMVNSGPFDGTPTKDRNAVNQVIRYLEKNGLGKSTITFGFRDWVFARQRYWGEPIPILKDQAGAVVRALEVSELPLELPPVDDFRPTGTGESPLSRAKSWQAVESDGATFYRELDTMPGSAGSSWYFLRFCDPHNEQEFCAREKSDYWMPVDLYMGGPEHAVGHLIYSRVWQMFLKDLGLVRDDEPFAKLRHQGMILGEVYYSDKEYKHRVPAEDVVEREGAYFRKDTNEKVFRRDEKMSKRKGNVVNPDEMIAKYGADALRVYLCFLGPLETDKPWATVGLEAQHTWLRRVWRVFFETQGDAEDAPDLPRADSSEASEAELRVLHKAIKKVTEDIENLSLNTAISALHVVTREFTRQGTRSRKALAAFAQLLAPFAPHLAEELWQKGLGMEAGISFVPWPTFDTKYTTEENVTIPVQINGKVRSTVEVPRGSTEDAVKSAALALEPVARAVEGKTIARVIFVADRMLNLVVK